jgi:hypothetical protein
MYIYIYIYIYVFIYVNRSAACASCAVPGLFDSITLIVKEPNGIFRPENEWTRQAHIETASGTKVDIRNSDNYNLVIKNYINHTYLHMYAYYVFMDNKKYVICIMDNKKYG